MIPQRIFEQIEEHFNEVVLRDSELGQELWNTLIELHPADIAQFLSNLSKEDFLELYATFPENLQLEVFHMLSDPLKAHTLSVVKIELRTKLLEDMQLDEFADLVELIDQNALKAYFKLMRKKDREKVVELMQFWPESAGGVMDIDIITFLKDLTIGQCIQILQKLEPKTEMHEVIYITNQANKLLGHINIQDLLIKNPKTKLSTIMKPNEYVARAHEDREIVAQQMLHYNLSIVPVVDENDQFLGVIPSETLAEIIEEESAENIYRISAMAPIKHTYFETPFFRLFFERGYILVILLLVESFTSIILQANEEVLAILPFLLIFQTMLVSIGGNTSSQTSAIVIQGLASGEIGYSNAFRFLRREFLMALMLAVILGATAFMRVYLHQHHLLGSIAIGLTASAIALTSVVLGSILPLILKRIGSDPAFSAGPFLATAMDILGMLMFVYIVKLVLIVPNYAAL